MKKTILIAAVMFLAFSVAANAQALLQVGSTPMTAASSCGATELAGEMAFTQVSGSVPITTGTITINYGVPVVPTNTAQFTVVNNANNIVAGPTAISVAAWPFLSNSITIPVAPIPGGEIAAPYTIRVTGVSE